MICLLLISVFWHRPWYSEDKSKHPTWRSQNLELFNCRRETSRAWLELSLSSLLPPLYLTYYREIVHHYLHSYQVLQKSDIVKLQAKTLLVEDAPPYFENARTKLKRNCLPNTSIHSVRYHRVGLKSSGKIEDIPENFFF